MIDLKLDVNTVSPAASMALLKGCNAMCPHCRMEDSMPRNVHGAAIHGYGKPKSYECHADSETWRGVPEFDNQPALSEGEGP